MKNIRNLLFLLLPLALVLEESRAFIVNYPKCASLVNHKKGALYMANGKTGTSKSFRISVKLPVEEGVKEEVIICEPVLKEKSKIIEVRYPIPYALDVEKNEVTGLPTCYLAGWNGEVPDDILRYCSAWNEDGECIIHDCCESSWEECVQALCSNLPERTDEVVLLFERSLRSVYNV